MRGNDRGQDFNDQWNDSVRRAKGRASRGEGPWVQDKYLERVNAKPRPAHHAKQSEGCADKAAALLILAAGAGWGVVELIGKVTV